MDQPRLADATRALRHVFLRDMMLLARIGIHPHEQSVGQRIRLNIDLAVQDDAARGMSRAGVGRDALDRVLDYEALAGTIRTVALTGHIGLVETLAERLAEACLADSRVVIARVRVEKLDAFDDMLSVGVEIERRSEMLSTPAKTPNSYS